MSGDLLERAARALREETDANAEGSQFSRARVLASLHQSRVRRRSRLVFLVPFWGVFAAASAWGMASGRVPELARSVAHALGLAATPSAKPARLSDRPTAPAPRLEAAPAPAAEPTPAAPPPTPELAPAASVHKPKPSPAPRAPAPRAAHNSIAEQADTDPAHELYRAAHQAHFVDHDWARALAAWNLYLGQPASGRFALEAQYNRALCLLRLGRSAEARAALEPFASGEHGSYRQSDAQALLHALGRETPPPAAAPSP